MCAPYTTVYHIYRCIWLPSLLLLPLSSSSFLLHSISTGLYISFMRIYRICDWSTHCGPKTFANVFFYGANSVSSTIGGNSIHLVWPSCQWCVWIIIFVVYKIFMACTNFPFWFAVTSLNNVFECCFMDIWTECLSLLCTGQPNNQNSMKSWTTFGFEAKFFASEISVQIVAGKLQCGSSTNCNGNRLLWFERHLMCKSGVYHFRT